MGAAATSCAADRADSVLSKPDALSVIAPAGTPRPPFAFSKEDEALLDEIQRATFMYFWEAVNPTTGMVPDRSSVTFVSTGGLGFQLTALVIGAERGWITRAQGAERAEKILRVLGSDPDNQHAGLFQHFIDGTTAAPAVDGPEQVVSTADSGLLMAGVLTASAYFGGRVQELGDAMFSAANWRAFMTNEGAKPHERGFISLGWRHKTGQPWTEGHLLPYFWIDNGCEHRLVTFLGVAAPNPAHRVDPETYYRLRRTMGEYQDIGPMVWFPYSGAHFTATFSHCWINYAAMGPDDPSAFGAENRPSVDWWENSRRLTELHRRKSIDNPKGLPTFSEHIWGLNASDDAKGYAVPGVFPNLIKPDGWRLGFDYAEMAGTDDYGDGTVAPYTLGSAIMFLPTQAADALRHIKSLKGADGKALVWRDPGGSATAAAGYGFQDAFNLGGPGKAAWVGKDLLAIDQGPMLVAIENARTGLVWKTFHSHPFVKAAAERLKWPAHP